MPPVVSIVGKSKSGKTTLIEKIVPALKKKGYKIGIVKHAAHGFEMDKKGKDSWRHQNAGADMVIVAGLDKMAMVKTEVLEGLEPLIKYFEDMDLVITEGYKRESKPKIEVFRSVAHKNPLCIGHEDLVAFVSDVDMGLNVPYFGLEDIPQIADFIEKQYLNQDNAEDET